MPGVDNLAFELVNRLQPELQNLLPISVQNHLRKKRVKLRYHCCLPNFYQTDKKAVALSSKQQIKWDPSAVFNMYSIVLSPKFRDMMVYIASQQCVVTLKLG